MGVFSRRYPYWVLERKRNHALKHHGMEALDILHESLTKEDIVYWLYGGTLLGFVREGGFIADDTDIDIGVWYQRENHCRIEKCLARHNFNKNWEIIIDDVICIQRFEYKGVGIDFYYFVQSTEKVVSFSSHQDEYGKLYGVEASFDKDVFDSIKTIEKNGKSYTIPRSMDEKVLRPLYGDWKTPMGKGEYKPCTGSNQIHYTDKKALDIHHIPSVHFRRPGLIEILNFRLTGKIKY